MGLSFGLGPAVEMNYLVSLLRGSSLSNKNLARLFQTDSSL